MKAPNIMSNPAFVLRVSLFILLGLGASSIVGFEQENASELTFESLVRGIKRSRMSLRTGEFIANGVKSVKSTRSEYSGSARIRGVFDYREGLLRFDREEIQRRYTGREDDSTFKDEDIGTNLIETQDHLFVYNYGSTLPTNAIHSWIDRQRSSRKPRVNLVPLDFRCVGICQSRILFSGCSFEKVIKHLETTKPNEVMHETDSVYRLHWSFRDMMQRDVWIDTSRGFTPTKMRVEQRSNPDRDWHTIELTELSWDQFDGVWVLTSMKLEDRHLSLPDEPPSVLGKLTYRYKFEWVSVNPESTDKRRFTYGDFDAPDGTIIWDWSSGAPVFKRWE